jgi:hypothetical protein
VAEAQALVSDVIGRIRASMLSTARPSLGGFQSQRAQQGPEEVRLRRSLQTLASRTLEQPSAVRCICTGAPLATSHTHRAVALALVPVSRRCFVAIVLQYRSPRKEGIGATGGQALDLAACPYVVARIVCCIGHVVRYVQCRPIYILLDVA